MVDKNGKFTLIDFERSLEGCTEAECTEAMDLGMREDMDLLDYLN